MRSPYALSSLDWWEPPVPAPDPPAAAEHRHLVEQREALEQAAYAALASSPKRLATFRRLLTEAQHLVPIREEQVAEWTLPWPTLRRHLSSWPPRLARCPWSGATPSSPTYTSYTPWRSRGSGRSWPQPSQLRALYFWINGA